MKSEKNKKTDKLIPTRRDVDVTISAQQHQINIIHENSTLLRTALDRVKEENKSQEKILKELCNDLNITDDTSNTVSMTNKSTPQQIADSFGISESEEQRIRESIPDIINLQYLPNAYVGWEKYLQDTYSYFYKNKLHVHQTTITDLLSDVQLYELREKIYDEFTYKRAQCDKYDYMCAVACGLLGALVDILFVGAPGEGKLTQFSDRMIDEAVMKFAKFCGWAGPKEGSDPLKSAIGFLERKYRVNYDHQHGVAVGQKFSMTTKNHHIKNLAHSPDIVGLFFSILDQFTNSAHFIDKGRIIRIDTETFSLQGNNIAAKVFAGFVNWLGHLFSDMAGSSGASGRGSGIPIPFFSLLQFINIGEFGQYRQTFATIAVQIFEKGYDMRHGIALSIPVLTTELFTRLIWVLKQKIYHKKPWDSCLPSSNIPELNRMLFISHGALCIVDSADAAIRSGGQIITFLLNANIIAWVRLGIVALKEVKCMYRVGNINSEALEEYLNTEYQKLLKNS